jgi:signal transduction histidine kinase
VSNPPTVLYIEDDPASLQLVERALRHAGFNVVVAIRGLEGIDLARSIVPDLILTDLGLPDLSGRELTTALRADERFRHTPIVAVTAQGEEYRETAMASGITGFLTKPLDIATLPRKLEYYLHGGHDEIESDKLVNAQLQYTREVVGRLENRIRELESINESLYRLDYMKDTFIQLTAHELRTPLTLVYGYSRLISDYPKMRELMESDANFQSLVKGLVEAIERMQSIVEELLIVSRIMTDQIELSTGPVNLRKIVRMVIDSYNHALTDRHIILHFEPTQWPSAMRADGNLLQLAISNLVGNAIKYTPDGGSIYLTAQSNAERLRFSVRDTGIGIDPGDQFHIFEHFHTTQDMSVHSTSKTAFGGGGLGLGLPICKGIVEAHGGTIEVKSPGHDPEKLPGSEFIVEIPLNVDKKLRSKIIKRLQ